MGICTKFVDQRQRVSLLHYSSILIWFWGLVISKVQTMIISHLANTCSPVSRRYNHEYICANHDYASFGKGLFNYLLTGLLSVTVLKSIVYLYIIPYMQLKLTKYQNFRCGLLKTFGQESCWSCQTVSMCYRFIGRTNPLSNGVKDPIDYWMEFWKATNLVKSHNQLFQW